MNEFIKAVKRGIKEVEEHPRTCEICLNKETRYNVMLKYKDPITNNIMVMCDECMYKRIIEFEG